MWTGTETQITIYLIRHGQTTGNEESRYIGRTDESLSEKGRQLLLAERDGYPKADILFVSPMARCQETAKILYPNLEAVSIEEWKEMDFGAFEGKNYQELMRDETLIKIGDDDLAQLAVRDYYQKWIDSNGVLPFPNGESRDVFIARCGAGLQKMAQRLQESEAAKIRKSLAAAVIVHGGTIMALLSKFYGGAYYEYQAGNGEWYCCSLHFGGETLSIHDAEKFGQTHA